MRNEACNAPRLGKTPSILSLGRRCLPSAAIGAVSLLGTACSPLGLLNGMAPKRLSARDIAYGPGPRRRLDVYAPEGTRDDAPVVVFLYGGSWDSGAKEEYRFVGGALAAAGCVTIIPDYRLYPEVVFPTFLDDCAAAFAWACVHAGDYGGGGPMFLMGHSAGAYNAAMLALDPSYLARATRGTQGARRPLAGTVGIAGPYDFLPVQTAELRAIFGQPPTPPATQPIDHVSGANAPMLLLAGASDTTVLPRNTVRLAARIRAAGGPRRAASIRGSITGR